MNLTFFNNIPQPSDNPSDSQASLLQNNQSISSWAGVDHFGYENANGGQHQQVSLPVPLSADPTQTGTASEIYSKVGTAVSSASGLFFKNSQAAFQINVVRAWGYANSSGIIASQSGNISGFTANSTGNYSIVLTSGAVGSANFAVLVSAGTTDNISSTYNITGTGTFTLLFFRTTSGTPLAPANFSFMVLQV